MHRSMLALLGFVACARAPAPTAARPEPETSSVTARLSEEEASARPAPDGYEWVACEGGLHCKYLKPDGWFAYQEAKGRTQALFITERPFSPPEKRFEVGLTVNVVRDLEERLGITPRAFMQQMLQTAASQALEASDIGQAELFEGVHTAYVSLVVPGPPGGENVVLQEQIIANNFTGTVYVLIFEAPESQWDHAWFHGRTIFDHLQMSKQD